MIPGEDCFVILETKTYEFVPTGLTAIQKVYVDRPFQVFLTNWETGLYSPENIVYFVRVTREFKLNIDEYICLPKEGTVADPGLYIPVTETTEVTLWCKDGAIHTFKPKNYCDGKYEDFYWVTPAPVHYMKDDGFQYIDKYFT